jgi:hypothetical protein
MTNFELAEDARRLGPSGMALDGGSTTMAFDGNCSVIAPRSRNHSTAALQYRESSCTPRLSSRPTATVCSTGRPALQGRAPVDRHRHADGARRSVLQRPRQRRSYGCVPATRLRPGSWHRRPLSRRAEPAAERSLEARRRRRRRQGSPRRWSGSSPSTRPSVPERDAAQAVLPPRPRPLDHVEAGPGRARRRHRQRRPPGRSCCERSRSVPMPNGPGRRLERPRPPRRPSRAASTSPASSRRAALGTIELTHDVRVQRIVGPK